MLKRIWKALLRLFGRVERKKDNCIQTEVEIASGENVVAETDTVKTDDGNTVEMPVEALDYDRRIELLTSGLKPYRRRTPEIRKKEVAGFGEAYRFWLRMCGTHIFTCERQGGYLIYRATLQEADRILELTDMRGRKGMVATVRICGRIPEGQVKEIKFIVLNKKNEQ